MTQHTQAGLASRGILGAGSSWRVYVARRRCVASLVAAAAAKLRWRTREFASPIAAAALVSLQLMTSENTSLPIQLGSPLFFRLANGTIILGDLQQRLHVQMQLI